MSLSKCSNAVAALKPKSSKGASNRNNIAIATIGENLGLGLLEMQHNQLPNEQPRRKRQELSGR
jgi:hypothetical protein